MDFDLANVLKVVGPAASIIFAAWIFMGFLQQRYDAAIERYRSIIGEYRADTLPQDRRTKAKDEIASYVRRCDLMNSACAIGLVSAMLLILSLIVAELVLVFPILSPLKIASAGAALLGFVAVIAAASLVLVENGIARRQLRSELQDVPDLARRTNTETAVDHKPPSGQ